MFEASKAATGRDAKFDAYVPDYNELHQRSVRSSGEDSEYFARYKLSCLERAGVTGPVLDYGCGVGNLTRLLADAFAEVHGSDVSSESVRSAKEHVPKARFRGPGESSPNDYFGTVVVAGVLHHVAPVERAGVLRDVYKKLRPGGKLAVFEHNPLNPVTRKIVRECPYDDDAVLLSPRELRSSIAAAGFEQVDLKYIVFFPRLLARLRPIEPKLSWLCAGAQTMTLACRASR